MLFSFRRCPYAMRARLALHASATAYEHREVALKNKPASLLALSPKATVPVLCLPSAQAEAAGACVLDQSLDIMLWALRQHDPQGWLPDSPDAMSEALALIAYNDGPFKQQLDRYKYPQRAGLHDGTTDRDLAAEWLQLLHARLTQQPFLAGGHWGLQDAAIAPFVRQYARTDLGWFADQAWPALAHWLAAFEASQAFAHIMHKHAPWAGPADAYA